jgi:GAF domain-containing protein
LPIFSRPDNPSILYATRSLVPAVTPCEEFMSDTATGRSTNRVAAHLIPTRSFDTACALVIEYLAQVAPLGMWAVTRIHDDEQVVLVVDSPAYEVPVGAQFPYSASFCRSMVTGTAPQIAPDVSVVPAYAATALTAPITVGAYVGTPIVNPDGELFGTVCGYDPA